MTETQTNYEAGEQSPADNKIELVLIVGDPESDDFEFYEAKRPTLGSIRRWYKFVEGRNAGDIPDVNNEAGLDALTDFVVDLIDDPGFTKEKVQLVDVGYFLAIFNEANIARWMSQLQPDQKKIQETIERARARAKK